jgi:uncharacterized protein (DUF433 family)
MQKVEGSNPFSRFFANSLHMAGWVWHWPPKQDRTIPHIASISGTSARNDADAHGLAAISADFALHWSRIRGSGRAARYPCLMALERITVDPNRMRGLPSIRDTRVTVSAVLGQLAAGASIDELLADYPYLEREDVLAALEYAAAAAQERELEVVVPAA